MARKTLEDFDGDYQAYADYLESPECTNDDEIDIVAKAYQLRLPHNPSSKEKIALILLHERQPYTSPVQPIHYFSCRKNTL